MPLDIFTPLDLYRIMFDPRQTVATSQWLTMFFPNSFVSTQEEISFVKINARRPIAPFMLPNLPGKPIYRRDGERLETFKPAYTKPKDSIRPQEMLALQPGELTRRLSLQTPEARYNAEVIRITNYQRSAIERLWDYMAAKAVLDGAITINYMGENGQAMQPITIDFGRAPGHTKVLTAGNRWGEAGVSIFNNLQSWIDEIALAEFGGSIQHIIMGPSAAVPFMADVSNTGGSLKDKLDTNYRGAEEVAMNRGLIITDPLNPFTLLGRLSNGVFVWRFSGPAAKFESSNGTLVDIMDPRDVLLAGAVDGVKAFGAILDSAFNLQVAEIFTKMWDQHDPSARFIMSQSAPLMIPVFPNTTMRVRVVA